MTVCPWCGQQSQSEINCDWCKRPIADRKFGPPVGARNDMDFLKEDGDGGERGNVLRFGIIGVGAVTLGALLFFLIRGTNSVPDDQLTAQQDGGPPRPAANAPAPSAQLVSSPAFQVHRSDWWVQQWNSGADIISNARDWTKNSPATRGSANVSTNKTISAPVKLNNVVLSMVALPNGEKRLVGRVDISNSTDRNVLDFRAELVWGDKDYQMIALQGDRKGMHQVYERALKPGQKMSVQLVSLKIKNHPDGTPNSVRLTSWLDGPPGISIDEYPIQLGH